VPSVRANAVDGLVALDGPGSGLEDRAELAERSEARTEFLGEVLPECGLQAGLIAWFETITADLEANGVTPDARLFAADLFSSHWLFGDLSRLVKGAPWYYGGLPGFESADYLLVPLCPTSVSTRKLILEAVQERAPDLTEVRRTQLYVLYEITKG